MGSLHSYDSERDISVFSLSFGTIRVGGCCEIQPRDNPWMARKELFRVERTAYSISFILILQKNKHYESKQQINCKN